MTMYGWISAEESDRSHLEEMGISVGPFILTKSLGEIPPEISSFFSGAGTFEKCMVTERSFKILEPHWGHYI